MLPDRSVLIRQKLVENATIKFSNATFWVIFKQYESCTTSDVIPNNRSNHFVDFFQRNGGLQRPQEFYCLTGCKKLNCNHLERIFVIIKSFSKAKLESFFLTFSTFLTTWRAFLAANPPIDTWSSVPALVDKESTDAGWQRVLFSDTEKINWEL